MPRERRRFVFRGRVQGVGFRATAQGVAEGLGLGGFVRNLADGSVEAEVEGEPSLLDEFAARLERRFGPKIHDVTASPMTLTSDDPADGRFEIRYGD